MKKSSFFKKTVTLILVLALGVATVYPGHSSLGEEKENIGMPMTGTWEYSKDTADYSLNVDAGNKLFDLSDLMYGIFLEDINASCDGGLSAEMVENRSFEYGSKYGCNVNSKWGTVGTVTRNVVDGSADGSGLNENNPHYVVLSNSSGQNAGLANEGFLDGMSIEENLEYRFSVYVKGIDGYSGEVQADLTVDGESVASGVIPNVTDEWKKYELTLTPDVTAASVSDKAVQLQITIGDGSCAFDMVSLMPQNNIGGFRAELVERLKDMKPSFFRFPGGCVTEGTSTPDDAYNWKQSIGCDENGEPLEFNGVFGDEAARRIGENNDWNYYMSYDLGFYEYFELCEYLDTLAIPVLNAGLGCDVRGSKGGHTGEELQKDIQTALDLVEFCRGDETTKWGAVRISMGHKEPFKLKYIGIGNEQNNEYYFNNYSEFVKAFAEAAEENPEMYGDIQLAMSPIICEGTGWYKSTLQRSYTFADKWLQENPEYSFEQWASCYDHHNYNTPEWFFKNCDYFAPNNYSRTDCNGNYGGKFDVFLGEYAAHVEDNPNALVEALAEAACMTSLEQNGDIVKMACYAPLFCSVDRINWKWNMIYFNNNEVLNTTNYYAQKMFMNHIGTKQLYSRLIGAENVEKEDFGGSFSIGFQNMQADFKNVQVTDEKNGEVYEEDSFTTDVSDEYLFDNSNLENYTLEADFAGTGEDGEVVLKFAKKDESNYYTWNVGKDGSSFLQTVVNGSAKAALSSTKRDFTPEEDKTYHLKMEVDRKQVKCYIDGEQYAYYNVGDTDAQAYQSVNLDKNGDIIIKLVNVTDSEKTFAVSVKNAENMKDTGTAYCLTGNDLNDKNEMGSLDNMETKQETVTGLKEQFNYSVPKYSITILRIPTDDAEVQPVVPTETPVSTILPTISERPATSQPPVNTKEPFQPISNTTKTVKKGTVFVRGTLKYRVTKTGKKAAVTVVGVTAKGRKKGSIKVEKSVYYQGRSFVVTAVANGAFKNLKKLKQIIIGKNVKTIGKKAFVGNRKLGKAVIQSKALKRVGGKAFGKTCKEIKIYLPSKKFKVYQRLLKGKGLTEKAKFMKIS